MKEYILAVDGGGTKTVGVLYDLKGHEIKRSIQGFANFSVNTEKTIDHLLAVVNDLYDPKIAYIQIGVAGYTNFEGKQTLIDDLKAKYKCPVSIVTDAEIALYAIKGNHDNPVILVLGGTGSVVIYEHQKQIKMIGGFGHLLGDEGSGYHLAITALKHVINQFEDQKEISKLSLAILDAIHADTHQDIKSFVYNNDKSEIATLSEFIATYAKSGNKEAIALFKNEAKLLANQTLKAIRSMPSKQKIRIGFKGGFLLNAPFVKETLLEALNQEDVSYIFETSSSEPVAGAYYLAKKQMDKR